MLRRGKRRVRVHCVKGPTFEGVQLGRRPIGGHYVLIVATVVEADGGGIRTVDLDGHVEIPAENVVFLEVVK